MRLGSRTNGDCVLVDGTAHSEAVCVLRICRLLNKGGSIVSSIHRVLWRAKHAHFDLRLMRTELKHQAI